MTSVPEATKTVDATSQETPALQLTAARGAVSNTGVATVVATVINTGSTLGTGSLRATVELPPGRTASDTTIVQVHPGGTGVFTIEFRIPVHDWLRYQGTRAIHATRTAIAHARPGQ